MGYPMVPNGNSSALAASRQAVSFETDMGNQSQVTQEEDEMNAKRVFISKPSRMQRGDEKPMP
jgi:hypothetical protein